MSNERMIEIAIAECKDRDKLDSLDGMMAFLTSARELIPVEFRHTARLEYNACSDYDDCHAELQGVSVNYTRPETISEREDRDSSERAAEERRRVSRQMMMRSKTWWADVDRLNFSMYTKLVRKNFPDMPEEDIRLGFHREALGVQATGVKPFWWLEEVSE